MTTFLNIYGYTVATGRQGYKIEFYWYNSDVSYNFFYLLIGD